MRRTGGVIPPGRAGLILLAAALVPAALAACKPLARAIGKGLKKAGEMAEKIADNSEIAEKEEAKATVTEAKAEEPKKAKPAASSTAKKPAAKKPAAKKSSPKAKPA